MISQIAKNKLVEQIVRNIGIGEDPEALKDLSQDIYMCLLEKPPELINHLMSSGEINYYIARIAYNQLRSSTSPYAIKYRRDIRLKNIDDMHSL